MRLSDNAIKNQLRVIKDLVIDPEPTDEQITGVTVDIHLSKDFKYWPVLIGTAMVDPGNNVVTAMGRNETSLNEYLDETAVDYTIDGEDDGFILEPGMFCLGATEERIKIPNNLVGWLDGRSTLARIGIQVHVTAHRIDPGWDGQVVLEFYNCGPHQVLLRPGMKIGALSFETIQGSVDTPYLSRGDATYKNQTGVVSAGGDPTKE